MRGRKGRSKTFAYFFWPVKSRGHKAEVELGIMSPIRRLAQFTLAFIIVTALAGHARAQQASSPVNSSAQVSSGFGGGSAKVKGKPSHRTSGLKLGSSRLHGDLTLEFGYDSNVFFGSGDENVDEEVGSVYLGTKPTISLGNMDNVGKATPKLLYAIILGYSYKRYLQELSGRDQKDFHGANASVLLNAFPGGKVSFDVHETFVRTSQPRYGTSNKNFDRDMNVAGAGISYRPGGGLLDFRLGYRFVVDFFEADDLKGANYYYHQPEFRAKWKFFPKTSFWLGVTWQFVSYTGEFNVGGDMAQNNDSKPIRVMTGVTGQFTSKLSFNAGIGYAYSWYDNVGGKGQYNLPIAMADMAWTITPTAKLTLGYQHDFRDSMWGNYFMMDTAFLNYNHQIKSRVDLSATARWIMAQYHGIYLPSGYTGPGCAVDTDECERTDHGVQIGISGNYHITDWVSAGLGYTLYANMTDFYTEHDPGTGLIRNNADFVKHLAYLHVNFSY
jgi:hypothetical protein